MPFQQQPLHLLLPLLLRQTHQPHDDVLELRDVGLAVRRRVPPDELRLAHGAQAPHIEDAREEAALPSVEHLQSVEEGAPVHGLLQRCGAQERADLGRGLGPPCVLERRHASNIVAVGIGVCQEEVADHPHDPLRADVDPELVGLRGEVQRPPPLRVPAVGVRARARAQVGRAEALPHRLLVPSGDGVDEGRPALNLLLGCRAVGVEDRVLALEIN
mmetsp:Transcript_53991/g.157610  ORF Transcript_53991/g.157610 Transcript_53991/m.157610 type:complete len:216 (+) Transcript_53991:204-851(+)